MAATPQSRPVVTASELALAMAAAIMAGSLALPVLVSGGAVSSLGNDVGLLQRLTHFWVAYVPIVFALALVAFLAVVGWIWSRSGVTPRIGRTVVIALVLLAAIAGMVFIAFGSGGDAVK